MTVNKVILIGNLGQKPELRSTNSGLQVTNLRIATTDRRKGSDGQWADQTEWHSIVVYGNQAENVCRFLDKGRQVYVEGRLSTRSWQDKDGNERRTTEVIAQTVRFLGSKGDGQSRGDSSSRSGGYSRGNSGGGYSDSQGGLSDSAKDAGNIPF